MRTIYKRNFVKIEIDSLFFISVDSIKIVVFGLKAFLTVLKLTVHFKAFNSGKFEC